MSDQAVVWRSGGVFTPNSTARAGLVEESRVFLAEWHAVGSTGGALKRLLDGALPQRSRESRRAVVDLIRLRLCSWNPPQWALAELHQASSAADPAAYHAMLLMHIARQDAFLYSFVQNVIAPRWFAGERPVYRGDAMRYLDDTAETHPEVQRWTLATRLKLAGNTLSILGSCGLLSRPSRGGERRIIEPHVPVDAKRHLVKLLRAEGLSREEAERHADWRIWLLPEEEARRVVSAAWEEASDV